MTMFRTKSGGLDFRSTELKKVIVINEVRVTKTQNNKELKKYSVWFLSHNSRLSFLKYDFCY
jgi:hypothetical protein